VHNCRYTPRTRIQTRHSRGHLPAKYCVGVTGWSPTESCLMYVCGQANKREKIRCILLLRHTGHPLRTHYFIEPEHPKEGSCSPWRSGSRANRASMLLRMPPSPPDSNDEEEGRFFLAWQATRDGEWVVRGW